MNEQIQKLAEELKKKYSYPFPLWNELSKHVLERELEARIEGMESVPEFKVNLIAYREAKNQLQQLRGGE